MSSFYTYLSYRWPILLGDLLDHVIVVAITLCIASVIALSLGLTLYRTERPAAAALGVASVFVTIPSFALFSLLIPVLGLGYPPTIVALVMYALLPILRNTITGLRSVDPAIVESARGMGMTKTMVLLKIELPLAWPVILTGIRVSMLIVLGIAAIAAYVNGPGLGQPIFGGLARIGTPNGTNMAVAGTLGIVILAIVLDLFLAGITKATAPRGRQK